MSKYEGLIIARTTAFLDANTGEVCNNLTDFQKLSCGILAEGESKFVYVELYQKVGTVTGNTYTEVAGKFWAEAEKLHKTFPVPSTYDVDFSYYATKKPKAKNK